MKKTGVVVVLSLFAASTMAAQGRVPGAPRGAMIPAAKLLLANTAELGLNDQQVVRLAGIARRSEARRTALRATMDSARARFAPGRATAADSAARRQFRERMRTEMDRAREQQRADLRDAIAVLTPDQQARAWELAASRRGSGAMRGMRRGGGMRERGMRPGPGARVRPQPRPMEG